MDVIDNVALNLDTLNNYNTPPFMVHLQVIFNMGSATTNPIIHC